MSVAVAVRLKESSGRTIRVYGTLTLSGSYVSAGDSLPMSAFGAPTTKPMLNIEIFGNGGYFYEYDRANQKLKVRQSAGAAAPLAELAAAAYPAGATGDTISFEAVFPKFG